MGGKLVKTIPAEVQDVWDESLVKRSPVEWALKYLWDKEEIDVVLSGMSNNNDLDENLKIAEEGFTNSLTPDEKDIIKEVRKVYRFRKQVDCTQCGYCMPCPQGLDILGNFLPLNYLYMFQDI